MFFFHINSEHFEVDLHLFKENSIKKVIKSVNIHVIIVSQIHGINVRQDAYSLSPSDLRYLWPEDIHWSYQ